MDLKRYLGTAQWLQRTRLAVAVHGAGRPREIRLVLASKQGRLMPPAIDQRRADRPILEALRADFTSGGHPSPATCRDGLADVRVRLKLGRSRYAITIAQRCTSTGAESEWSRAVRLVDGRIVDLEIPALLRGLAALLPAPSPPDVLVEATWGGGLELEFQTFSDPWSPLEPELLRQARYSVESHLRESGSRAAIVRRAGVAIFNVHWRSPSHDALSAEAALQQANLGWTLQQAPAPRSEGPAISLHFGDELNLATLMHWIENHPVLHSEVTLDPVAVVVEPGDQLDPVPRIRIARPLLSQERVVFELPRESVSDPMGHPLLDTDLELKFGASDLPLAIDPIAPRLRRALVSLRYLHLEFSEAIPLASVLAGCKTDGRPTTWLVHDGPDSRWFRTLVPLTVGSHRFELAEKLTDFRGNALRRPLAFDFEVPAWQFEEICQTPANATSHRQPPPVQLCEDTHVAQLRRGRN